MTAPAFWWRPPGVAARLLQPAAWVYGLVAAFRLRGPGTRAGVPVVCVGNVTVGGAGKTPAAIAVAGLLRDMGREPAFLTRGYGGFLRGPVQVDHGAHCYPEIGDEALLLARHALTVVSADRPAGAALCQALGADAIVMDDGLQNPSLRKDLCLAVFDSTVGIGNGCVLPAGPLRARLHAQWPLIDTVVLVGNEAAGRPIAAAATERGVPVLEATMEPDAEAAAALSGRRVLAFAGIGRPEKFFATLRACGAIVDETRTFPDHHPYRAAEIGSLLDRAEGEDLLPVTTEKDLIRLVALPGLGSRLPGIATLPVTMAFRDPDRLWRALSACLG